MNQKTFFGWIAVFFLVLLTGFVPVQKPWKDVRGDHFIVYHFGEESFAQEVLRKAEQYYRQVGEDLGYVRRSDFWQWDKRVSIYIYKTKEDFLKKTGRIEWSEGYADYVKRTIVSYEWETGFLESLLPHEITHLIFRDYVGFRGEVPLWLDEGIAQWEEPEKRRAVRSVMRFYLQDGKGYSMKNLATTDVRNVQNKSAVQLFYVQAASVVDFLVTKYGPDSFVFFCRQLRDGKTIEAALPFVYPTQMRTVQEMEEKWKVFISDGS